MNTTAEQRVLTELPSEDATTQDHTCSHCYKTSGRLLACTAQCHRSFHIPSSPEGIFYRMRRCHDVFVSKPDSCNVLELDEDQCMAVWSHRASFVCPLCWKPSKKRCSQCHCDEGELLSCNVGGCDHVFCCNCQSRLQMTVSFGPRCFICPHHFCNACRCIGAETADNPILQCLECPKAFHLNCIQDKNSGERTHIHSAKETSKNSVFQQSVMICEEHQVSINCCWKKRLNEWKQSWLDSIGDAPTSIESQGMVWISTADLCTNAHDGLMDVSEDDVELEDVLTELPETRQNVQTLFTQAAEKELQTRPQTEDTDEGIFPYDIIPTIIGASQLEEFKNAAEVMQQRPDLAQQLITPQYLSKMKRMRESMRSYLAPLIHGGNYTSFGRHFTREVILEEIAKMLAPIMENGDMLVDMSCGHNFFISMVKQHCARRGVTIHGRAYDIITPCCLQDWVRSSWFDVQREELPDGNGLIIGLNPPFGVNGRLAELFLKKAAEFEPRYIVLICPPMTRIPENYRVVFEDMQICGYSAFSTPTGKITKNIDLPSVRLLERADPPLLSQKRRDGVPDSRFVDLGKLPEIKRRQSCSTVDSSPSHLGGDVHPAQGQLATRVHRPQFRAFSAVDVEDGERRMPDFMDRLRQSDDRRIRKRRRPRMFRQRPLSFHTRRLHPLVDSRQGMNYSAENRAAVNEGKFAEAAARTAMAEEYQFLPSGQLCPPSFASQPSQLDSRVQKDWTNERRFRMATVIHHPSIPVEEERRLPVDLAPYDRFQRSEPPLQQSADSLYHEMSHGRYHQDSYTMNQTAKLHPSIYSHAHDVDVANRRFSTQRNEDMHFVQKEDWLNRTAEEQLANESRVPWTKRRWSRRNSPMAYTPVMRSYAACDDQMRSYAYDNILQETPPQTRQPFRSTQSSHIKDVDGYILRQSPTTEFSQLQTLCNCSNCDVCRQHRREVSKRLCYSPDMSQIYEWTSGQDLEAETAYLNQSRLKSRVEKFIVQRIPSEEEHRGDVQGNALLWCYPSRQMMMQDSPQTMNRSIHQHLRYDYDHQREVDYTVDNTEHDDLTFEGTRLEELP